MEPTKTQRDKLKKLMIDGTFKERVRAFQRLVLEEALEAAKGNKAAAGRSLGLDDHQIRYLCKKFGVTQVPLNNLRRLADEFLSAEPGRVGGTYVDPARDAIIIDGSYCGPALGYPERIPGRVPLKNVSNVVAIHLIARNDNLISELPNGEISVGSYRIRRKHLDSVLRVALYKRKFMKSYLQGVFTGFEPVMFGGKPRMCLKFLPDDLIMNWPEDQRGPGPEKAYERATESYTI